MSRRAVSWHLNIQDWNLGGRTGYVGVVSISSSFISWVWINHLESAGREEDWDRVSQKMERGGGLVSRVEHGVLEAKRSVSLRKEGRNHLCQLLLIV